MHRPASVLLMIFAGQEAITGACESLTVTVKMQALVFPLLSLAVQVTMVAPLLKALPLDGEQTTVGLPQLSVAVGAV